MKNRHFLGVCKEKMIDYQYRENGARNIYSNYNKMRAYVECSPNQSKSKVLKGLLTGLFTIKPEVGQKTRRLDVA